jgi:hypothetical protein
MPERPYTQYNEYILKQYPTLTAMQEMYKQGKLNATQSLFMADHKPEIEFYDREKDPHEVNNLAKAPEHQKRIGDFGKRLDTWVKDMGDQGAFPEKEEAKVLA